MLFPIRVHFRRIVDADEYRRLGHLGADLTVGGEIGVRAGPVHRHLDGVQEIWNFIVEIRQRELEIMEPGRGVVEDRQILWRLDDGTFERTGAAAGDFHAEPVAELLLVRAIGETRGEPHFHHVSRAHGLAVLLRKGDELPQIRPGGIDAADQFRGMSHCGG